MLPKYERVWLFLTAMLCVVPAQRAGASPVCASGQAGCRSLSLASLLDRAIQHSSRMHGLSSVLHSQWHLEPSRNLIGIRKCHTSNILTPNGKEHAQRLGREELTEVILKLLLAWGNPLERLQQGLPGGEDHDSDSSNKTLQLSHMVQQLRVGVQKLAEKLGMISNYLEGLLPSKIVDPASSSEVFSLTDHDLLYCLRRDSDKVQNYLKMLKCRIYPEGGC